MTNYKNFNDFLVKLSEKEESSEIIEQFEILLCDVHCDCQLTQIDKIILLNSWSNVSSFQDVDNRVLLKAFILYNLGLSKNLIELLNKEKSSMRYKYLTDSLKGMLNLDVNKDKYKDALDAYNFKKCPFTTYSISQVDRCEIKDINKLKYINESLQYHSGIECIIADRNTLIKEGKIDSSWMEDLAKSFNIAPNLNTWVGLVLAFLEYRLNKSDDVNEFNLIQLNNGPLRFQAALAA